MNLSDLTKKYLLNETECLILDEIIYNIQQGNSKINIRDVAAKSYVSTTTIIKLAKKMGYGGYSELIFSLRNAIYNYEHQVSSIDLDSLLETVNQSAIDQLVNDLYTFRQDKIYIVGLGFSTIATSYMIKRLAMVNILAYDGSPIDTLIGDVTPTLVIFLSKSGETDDLIQIAKRSLTYHHKITVISTSPKSTMVELAHDSFIIKSQNNQSFVDIPDFYVGRCILFFEYILSLLLRRLENQ